MKHGAHNEPAAHTCKQPTDPTACYGPSPPSTCALALLSPLTSPVLAATLPCLPAVKADKQYSIHEFTTAFSIKWELVLELNEEWVSAARLLDL